MFEVLVVRATELYDWDAENSLVERPTRDAIGVGYTTEAALFRLSQRNMIAAGRESDRRCNGSYD